MIQVTASHTSSKWHSFSAVSCTFPRQVTDSATGDTHAWRNAFWKSSFLIPIETFLAMVLCINLQIVTEENILKYSRTLFFLRYIHTHLLLYTSFSQAPQTQEGNTFQPAMFVGRQQYPDPPHVQKMGHATCLFVDKPYPRSTNL